MKNPQQWRSMNDRERDLLYWVLSSLMVAEERISTQFCGLVLAQDDEEEGSYLATQLVDENRHMQFYARFQNEVVAESVSPPSEGAWDVLGVEDGELGAYGLNALTRRLNVIGVSLG